MKALFINGKEDIVLNEVSDDLKATSEQVIIQPEYVGICGSDIAYLDTGKSGVAVIREPLIPGHELSGVLDDDFEINGVQYKKGTKVTVHPATYGEKIDELPNNPEVWPNGAYLGSARYFPHQQGAMVEKMLIDKEQVRILPENISLRVASLVEPLSVGIHAINLAEDVKDKDILISGAGPIGTLLAVAATVEGAKSATITDILDEPLSRVAKLGNIKTINVANETVADTAYDVVFECSGAPIAISNSFEAVKIGGTIIQVGNLPNKEIPLNLSAINAKQAKFIGSYRFNNEIDEAINMLNAHQELFEQTITHEFKLNEFEEAFNMAKDSKESCKVIFKIKDE